MAWPGSLPQEQAELSPCFLSFSLIVSWSLQLLHGPQRGQFDAKCCSVLVCSLWMFGFIHFGAGRCDRLVVYLGRNSIPYGSVQSTKKLFALRFRITPVLKCYFWFPPNITCSHITPELLPERNGCSLYFHTPGHCCCPGAKLCLTLLWSQGL